MEIKVQNVSFKYNHHDLPILDSISLKLNDNKVTGIIGLSGSGKSTLLDVICGIKLPIKGKVIINDMILSRKSDGTDLKRVNKYIGYLPQDLEKSFCTQTVRDDLIVYLEEIKIESLENKIVEVFKSLGLNLSLLDCDPFSLSNSELRQVRLAFILIKNPDIIILDEPTAGMNNVQKQMLVNILTTTKKMLSKIIVLVSHDIDFINKIADDVVVLEDGKVIKSEKTSETFGDVKFCLEHDISIPKTVFFATTALKEKGIKLPYRNEINDLVKDILRKL